MKYNGLTVKLNENLSESSILLMRMYLKSHLYSFCPSGVEIHQNEQDSLSYNLVFNDKNEAAFILLKDFPPNISKFIHFRH